jgi:anaerobic selenocysteine-containing dehydrogenase
MPAAPLHDPTATPQAGASTDMRTTTCYMCACRCGIRVHLRDGEVRYIEGNPDHPLNQGVICAKGSSGIMKQYSPARLTQPLKRKPGSERGANEFVPIEWDEAWQRSRSGCATCVPPTLDSSRCSPGATRCRP